MFCGKCGNEIKDGLAFCPVCGDRFNEVTYNAESNVAHKLNKNMKKRIISIVVAVAVVVGVVGIFRAIFSDSAEDIAIKYIEAATIRDWKKASEYLAMDFDNYIETAADAIMDDKNKSSKEYFHGWQNEFNYDFDKIGKEVEINEPWDILDAFTELWDSKFEEEFGEDFKVDVEIIEKEKVEEKKIKRHIKDINRNGYFEDYDLDIEDFLDSNEIGKAYKMTLEITSDNDDFDSYEKEIYVVKYDGDWKVLEVPDIYLAN